MEDLSKTEMSERMVTKIVAHFAEQGVIREDLNLEKLGYEPSEATANLFVDAMSWLSNEGIINTNQKLAFTMGSSPRALGFTLTSKGYAMLASPFEGELTLGAAIKHAQRTGQGYSNVGELLGGLLGAFTKSISS